MQKVNENSNLINKRELIELLEKYKGILNKKTINYLNSLIELEFSVIKNNIDESSRILLSELELYKKITIYNIYNRTLKLIEDNNLKLSISTDNEELNIYLPLNKGKCQIFKFDYEIGSLFIDRNTPTTYKISKIGNISLYKTVENSEIKNKELERLLEELVKLNRKKNPYRIDHSRFGSQATLWQLEQGKKILYCEEKIKELKEKTDLNIDKQKEIEITNLFNKIMLEDYGLTENDFELEEDDYYSIINRERDKSKLKETLIKKMPGISIENNIRYI